MTQKQPLQSGSFSGGNASQFFLNHELASSGVAVAALSASQNPLATPSNSSNYRSSSTYNGYHWSRCVSASPSIWSACHQSATQWPIGNHGQISPIPVCPASTNSNSSMGCCYPRGEYSSQNYRQSVPIQRISHHVAHQVASSACQLPPNMVSVFPSVPNCPLDASSRLPLPYSMHMSGSRILIAQPIPQLNNGQQVLPYYIPPQQIPPHLQSYVRAPLPQYRHVVPQTKELLPADTEYNLAVFSRFYVAVLSSIFAGQITSQEISRLEQFVEMLLSATHLSKSTLLMSFVFMDQWPKLTSAILQNTNWETRIVCSLVLANKMNDDNTFTNTSWGLVTKIAPSHLTTLELAWLDAMDWKMNLDQSSIEEWNHWDRCWIDYAELSRNKYPLSPTPPSVWSTGLVLESYTVAAC